MKYLQLTVAFLWQFAAAQNLPLNFQSYAIRLQVTSGENLVLTTKAGEAGITDNLKNSWRRIDPRPGTMAGVTFEQATFFNKDTGFLSGFIHNEKTDKYNIIYHTEDGGKKGKPLILDNQVGLIMLLV